VSYTAAEAFSGEYEIQVERLWGEALGNRARLEIVQHAGTPKETRSLVPVDLAQVKTVKVTLKNGRRSELVLVNPAAAVPARETTAKAEAAPVNPWVKLRQMAHPDLIGAKGISGGSASPGASHYLPSLAGRPKSGKQVAVNQAPLLQQAVSGSSLDLTAQVRATDDGRNFQLVMQPVFQAMGGGNRPPVNFNVVPGGN